MTMPITPNQLPMPTPAMNPVTASPATSQSAGPKPDFKLDPAPGAPGPTGVQGPTAAQGASQVEQPKKVELFREQEALNKEIESVMGQLNNGQLQGPEAYSRLIGLQMKAQQISFRVELVSKVIEHGTSGTKTVLQTQA